MNTGECKSPVQSPESVMIVEKFEKLNAGLFEINYRLRSNVDRIVGNVPEKVSENCDLQKTPECYIEKMHELLRSLESAVNEVDKNVSRLSRF